MHSLMEMHLNQNAFIKPHSTTIGWCSKSSLDDWYKFPHCTLVANMLHCPWDSQVTNSLLAACCFSFFAYSCKVLNPDEDEHYWKWMDHALNSDCQKHQKLSWFSKCFWFLFHYQGKIDYIGAPELYKASDIYGLQSSRNNLTVVFLLSKSKEKCVHKFSSSSYQSVW